MCRSKLNSKQLFFFSHFTESPRDASNKDSPASQADSGVFSIASSNSPSKASDGGGTSTANTSPDSPSRHRVYSGDLTRGGADNQCKYTSRSLNYSNPIPLLI